MKMIDFLECIKEIKENKNVGISYCWEYPGTPCKYNGKYGQSFFLARFYSRIDPNQCVSMECKDVLGEITKKTAEKILELMPEYEKNVFGDSTTVSLPNGKYRRVGQPGSETTYHF
jgi:hypothetical protein